MGRTKRGGAASRKRDAEAAELDGGAGLATVTETEHRASLRDIPAYQKFKIYRSNPEDMEAVYKSRGEEKSWSFIHDVFPTSMLVILLRLSDFTLETPLRTKKTEN